MYDRVYIYEYAGNLSSRIPLVKGDEDYIGFWREAGYSFLFFRKEKKAFLRGLFPPYRSELVIRHEDWESATPLDILRAGRLTIHPPWQPPSENAGITVCIDPGMAFGSGFHGSTKGCLILLDRLFQEFVPGRILDLGTGTGILSIACLKMGAQAAFSIDYNNLAIETAKKNRGLNRLDKKMRLWMGDARDFLYIPADLLIANLYYQVLDQITDLEAFYSRKYYLLSGLMEQEGREMEEKLKRRLELLETYRENSWVTFLFQNASLQKDQESR
jgi:ribosomal protein L11 methyltransferase